MSMKSALTFACLNMKKLAKLLDRLDKNGGKFPPFAKEFTSLFEKLIYFEINIEKVPINPIYWLVCRHSETNSLEFVFLFISYIITIPVI